MDVKSLYILRYRQGTQGVVTGFVTASSNAKAEEVGHAFCNQHPARRFIRVEPAVIADESMLTEPKPDDTKRARSTMNTTGVDTAGPVVTGNAAPSAPRAKAS